MAAVSHCQMSCMISAKQNKVVCIKQRKKQSIKKKEKTNLLIACGSSAFILKPEATAVDIFLSSPKNISQLTQLLLRVL